MHMCRWSGLKMSFDNLHLFAGPRHGKSPRVGGGLFQIVPSAVASSQSHNAYVLETATVYYRWHPLFGKSLRVVKRMKDRHVEHLICERPDQTLCSLPCWMFSLECTAFSWGQPAIAVEALSELRDFLTSLQKSSSCDKAWVTSPSQEEKHEILSEVCKPATESSPARSSAGGTSSERTAGTLPRASRAAREGRHSQCGPAEVNRRSE